MTRPTSAHALAALAATLTLVLATSAPADVVLLSDDFSDGNVAGWSTSGTLGGPAISYTNDGLLGHALFADSNRVAQLVSHSFAAVTLTNPGDFIEVTARMRLADIRSGGWNMLLTGDSEIARASFGTPTGGDAGGSVIGFEGTSIGPTAATGLDNSTSTIQEVMFLVTRTLTGYDFEASFSVSNTGSTTSLSHSFATVNNVLFDTLSFSHNAFSTLNDTNSRDWLVTDVLVTTNDAFVIPTPAALPAGLALLGLGLTRRRRR